MSAIDFIEDAGFLTLDAATADDAIIQLKARGDIAAVFTDIDMPGSLDGLELAHIVSREWPSIAIVVASGFRRALLEHLPSGGIFFPKPYDFRSVETALRRLIDQKKQIQF